MSTTPVTVQRDPSAALRQLCILCPAFERWWGDEETEDRLVDGVHNELTHHRLAIEFLDFFAKNHGSLTRQQLRALGGWVNEAVAIDDELGEAVASCFLRYYREQHLGRVLSPYLSAQARAKSRP